MAGMLIIFILKYINYIIIHVLLATSNILGFMAGVLTPSGQKYIIDVIIFIIEFSIGSLVLIIMSGLFKFFFTKSKDTIIYPFEVNTNQKTYTGEIISNTLVAELRRIETIFEHKFEEENVIIDKIILPKVTPYTEKLETNIYNLGNVNLTGMTLSVGEILIIVKKLIPFGGTATSIKGSLQEYDSEIHLIALMEGSRAQGWDISCEIKKSTKKVKIEQPINKAEISELIKELAFKITYDLSKEETKKKEKIKKTKGITAKTWVGFKYFTEAIDSYSQYTATKKLEHLRNALENCKKASQEEKDCQMLFYLFHGIGVSYADIADYRSAEDAFRRCIDITPDNPRGFISLGSVLGKLYQSDRALEAYNDALEACEKALEIKPEDSELWFYRGIVFKTLGMNKKAIEAFDEALKINPKYALAWANKGSVYGMQGSFLEDLCLHEKALKAHKEALESFKKALKLNPKLALTWANKGAAIIRLNEDNKDSKAYKKALKECTEALKINPKQNEAWYNMACAHSLMGKTEEAIVNLKYAVKLDPSLRKTAKGDPDFKNLQEITEFLKIVAPNETD